MTWVFPAPSTCTVMVVAETRSSATEWGGGEDRGETSEQSDSDRSSHLASYAREWLNRGRHNRAHTWFHPGFDLASSPDGRARRNAFRFATTVSKTMSMGLRAKASPPHGIGCFLRRPTVEVCRVLEVPVCGSGPQ